MFALYAYVSVPSKDTRHGLAPPQEMYSQPAACGYHLLWGDHPQQGVSTPPRTPSMEVHRVAGGNNLCNSTIT